jgi:hypothetical protein
MNMQQFSMSRIPAAVLLTVVFAGMLYVTGCKKSSSNPTAPTVQSVSTTADVADQVSDALASNNGGAMDQVNDVFELAGGIGIGAEVNLAKDAVDSSSFTRTYDPVAKAWSISLYRRASFLPAYFGVWTRNYWHQFRANGQAQQFRVTAGVTADTILHKLLSGTGYYWTPRLVHHLHGINSNWIVSNTNTDTVTVNGTYARSGVDTIKTAARAGRVYDHALSLTFVNVRGPRGPRFNRSDRTSGTIQGTYTATVTIPGKSPFTVTKTFTIILGGGNGTFTVDGTTYVTNLATGDH